MNFVEQLRNTRPELVAEYEAMDKETLLNQICAEVIDLIDSNERVTVFMELCSGGLGKTNYTPESIRTFVTQKQDADIKDWCFDICDEATDEEILEEVRKQAELSDLCKI